jgi:carboxymethylenebutenolidase
MVEDAYVNHIPVMTGDQAEQHCANSMSAILSPLCLPILGWFQFRTVGETQLVDEMVVSLTHTEEMPRMQIPLGTIVLPL